MGKGYPTGMDRDYSPSGTPSPRRANFSPLMHTSYPILVTIPECFDEIRDNNLSNAGLTALCEFLVKAVHAQGYAATIAQGGIDKTVILNIARRT